MSRLKLSYLYMKSVIEFDANNITLLPFKYLPIIFQIFQCKPNKSNPKDQLVKFIIQIISEIKIKKKV